jgi:hypothetical protein
MSKEEDNSAFPLHLHGDYGKGMSLRDYFAAVALQGLLVNGHHKNVRYSYIAQDAYKLADAMIEARKGDA